MKRIGILLIFSFMSFTLLGQQRTIMGTIVDSKSMLPLVGVSIMGDSTKNGCTTDIDGNFSLKTTNEVKSLVLSYIGYEKKIIDVMDKSNMGIITLDPKTFKLNDITITAQLAIPRKTPVASSTVYANKIDEHLGNNEFIEILKTTPGVHINRAGSGWGDSELFMRGFDNSNVAVMINGVPANDMENGAIYWSNWASLSDVASLIQTQRGVGANKLSSPAVGGTINIVTKGIETTKGGHAYYMIGNDGYSKYAFSISTGLMNNGWALTFQGSRAFGNGYATGTDFQVYSYFVNISKRFNDNHQLSLTAFGAPQRHHLRSNGLTKSEWEFVKKTYEGEKHWTRYNPSYGFDNNGQVKSSDYNKYHKPEIFVNHIWQISDKSNLSTTSYASWGRGYGYSGKANSDTYSEYDWYAADYGELNRTFRCSDGTFDYASIENLNISSKNGSQMIMSTNGADQDWYGVVSTFSTKFPDCLDWHIGVDLRYYKANHVNRIIDLYGGEYYIDPSRKNVSITDNVNAIDEWKNEHLGVGDAIYRNYDSHILQEGIFSQLEYARKNYNIFISGALNYSTYWRYDYLYYDPNNARSKNIGFIGGNIKTGANYIINRQNNVFVNVGYNSKAPAFKSGAFMSANVSNVTNKRAKNEKSLSAEIGYMHQNEYLNFKANAYYTKWMDKSMTKKGTLTEQYYVNMTGVGSRHMGLEFELRARPVQWLETGAMFSLGDWRWDNNNAKGYVYNIYGEALSTDGNITTPGAENHAWARINMDGVHVGGSAQTTLAVDAFFKPFKGFRIGAIMYYYANNYAYYSISGSSLSIGKDVYIAEPWKAPAVCTLDLHSSYHFNLGGFKATLTGQVNNLFNNYYIEKAWNPNSISKKENPIVNEDNVYMFYSLGRTWSLRLKVDF